tara:strand:+ start:296 stop:466 length:171 start_codon:yes stop_codon:yes gene_type:complete
MKILQLLLSNPLLFAKKNAGRMYKLGAIPSFGKIGNGSRNTEDSNIIQFNIIGLLL